MVAKKRAANHVAVPFGYAEVLGEKRAGGFRAFAPARRQHAEDLPASQVLTQR